MTNDTMVTIQGWVANEPALRTVGGTPVLNFRIGSTPRRFRRSTGEWVDGQTQWYGVSAWRHLAENGDGSLVKGDPVVIHGRLEHRTYLNRSGVEVVALEIDAITIGHDLTRGASKFRKSARAAGAPASPEVPSPGAPPYDAGPVAPPVEDPYAVVSEGNGPVPGKDVAEAQTAA